MAGMRIFYPPKLEHHPHVPFRSTAKRLLVTGVDRLKRIPDSEYLLTLHNITPFLEQL